MSAAEEIPSPSQIRLFEAVPFVSRLFGDSGGVGFDRIEGSNVIHHVENSLEFCEECVIPENIRVSRVHNIVLPTFRQQRCIRGERAARFDFGSHSCWALSRGSTGIFDGFLHQADQYEGTRAEGAG